MTDAALVARLLAGDREAGDALAAAHAGILKELIRKRLGPSCGPADSDNVYQQVWLLLLEEQGRRLRRYDPSRPLLPFLIGVSLNACRDYLKSERRRRPRGPDLETLAPLAASSGLPMEAEESRVLLAGALEKLQPRDRMILEWVELQGLSPQEVGRLLGVAPRSVSVLASRARDRLRELLKNREDLL